MTRLTHTHLFREIHEQPETLTRLLEKEEQTAIALATAVRERGITQVIIAARGTSDNAARYAKYVMGALNGLPVALAAPSLFSVYRQPPQMAQALVLGISQSGQSPDIVAVLAEARRQGALTAVITNQPDSPLAQQGDFVIPLHAGEERAVAATKTYTGELAAMALLAASLNGDSSLRAELRQIPAQMAQTLAVGAEISRLAERYRYMRHCVVIGRGYNYATAFELALKMKELTYTMVEPYSSADFMHGPLALVEQAFPAIVVAPSGAMLLEMGAFVYTLNQRGAETIIISDDAEVLAMGRTALGLGTAVPEWLSPLTAIVPGQLFALHLAHTRGYDVDAPRGIQKVTETR
ncbi:MAG: SIS domain-containing protein [Anaerolineae bacterium]